MLKKFQEHLVVHPTRNTTLREQKNLLYSTKRVLEGANMPHYIVTLADNEIQELKLLSVKWLIISKKP